MRFLPAALRAALNIATGTSNFRRRRFAPPYIQQYMRFFAGGASRRPQHSNRHLNFSPAALRAALNIAAGTSNFRRRRFAPP
jgi:hypothetical protein